MTFGSSLFLARLLNTLGARVQGTLLALSCFGHVLLGLGVWSIAKRVSVCFEVEGKIDRGIETYRPSASL